MSVNLVKYKAENVKMGMLDKHYFTFIINEFESHID